MTWVQHPKFRRVNIPDNCGNYTHPADGNKWLLHSTESGWGSLSAIDRLFSDRVLNAPQVAYDWDHGRNPRWSQYQSLALAGCALQRQDYCPTNGSGINVQIEIVGYAAESHTWPDEMLRDLADGIVVMANALRSANIAPPPFVNNLIYYGLDAGFTLATTNARQRLSCADFRGSVGFVGHQHVYLNSHWDPGKMDVDRLNQHCIEIDTGQPPQGELSMSDIQAILNELGTIKAGQSDLGQKIHTLQAKTAEWEQDTRALMGRTALKIPGDPHQWIIVFGDHGPKKYHIKDQAEFALFVQGEVLRDGLPTVELTDASQIAALEALPVLD